MSEIEVEGLRLTVLWSSFALAFALGAVMQRTHFCTLGAVADWVNMGDLTRLRMWLFAISVAVLGTNLLAATGQIDLSQSLYTGSRLTWLSYLVGGLSFGFGMVLASGCGSKTLVRIGGGSLKSLVVLIVMGLSAYITLKGILAVARVNWIDPFQIEMASGQDLPRFIAASTGGDLGMLQLGVSIGTALVLGGFCLKDREFRRTTPLFGASAVGLLMVCAWWVSGHLGHLSEDPTTLEEVFLATNSRRMEAFSFVAPAAYTLELLMFWSDATRVVTIGIAAVLGMTLGSALVALTSRTFRWEGFRDVQDTANHLVGGSLMGFGGVTAMGCTIGQGIAGVSTLAIGSFLTLAALIAGGWLGMRWQYWQIEHL